MTNILLNLDISISYTLANPGSYLTRIVFKFLLICVAVFKDFVSGAARICEIGIFLNLKT